MMSPTVVLRDGELEAASAAAARTGSAPRSCRRSSAVADGDDLAEAVERAARALRGRRGPGRAGDRRGGTRAARGERLRGRPLADRNVFFGGVHAVARRPGDGRARRRRRTRGAAARSRSPRRAHRSPTITRPLTFARSAISRERATASTSAAERRGEHAHPLVLGAQLEQALLGLRRRARPPAAIPVGVERLRQRHARAARRRRGGRARRRPRRAAALISPRRRARRTRAVDRLDLARPGSGDRSGRGPGTARSPVTMMFSRPSSKRSVTSVTRLEEAIRRAPPWSSRMIHERLPSSRADHPDCAAPRRCASGSSSPRRTTGSSKTRHRAHRSPAMEAVGALTGRLGEWRARRLAPGPARELSATRRCSLAGADRAVDVAGPARRLECQAQCRRPPAPQRRGRGPPAGGEVGTDRRRSSARRPSPARVPLGGLCAGPEQRLEAAEHRAPALGLAEAREGPRGRGRRRTRSSAPGRPRAGCCRR